MIALTGGGTGGHIFPNLSIIEELRRRGSVGEIIWIGEKGGKEEAWAGKAGVPFFGVRTGKLRRYFSLRNATDVVRVVFGILQCLFILSKRRPALLFSKGGFVSVPPVAAAWFLKMFGISRIPTITHESDLIPGLATRIISRFAGCVCISFEKTKSYLPGVRTVLTGNPVREVIRKGDRARGLSFLGFPQKLPMVFVVGGSLGASSLNAAVSEMLETGDLSFNLVHQCGSGNFAPSFPGGASDRFDGGTRTEERYRRFEFIDGEMGDVLAASDLVVSRSGAGALAELGLMRKPSVLVPLPRSKSRGEQIENARFFAEGGAAVMIEDEKLNGAALRREIEKLLGDGKKLARMGAKAGKLCVPDAQARIADLIEDLLR